MEWVECTHAVIAFCITALIAHLRTSKTSVFVHLNGILMNNKSVYIHSERITLKSFICAV